MLVGPTVALTVVFLPAFSVTLVLLTEIEVATFLTLTIHLTTIPVFETALMIVWPLALAVNVAVSVQYSLPSLSYSPFTVLVVWETTPTLELFTDHVTVFSVV